MTISASNVTIEGNDIGVLSNGTTVAGNRGDGVQINASSHGDLIGQINPVSSIDYYPTTNVYTSSGQAMPVSGWQGIRAADSSGEYLITGTSDSNGLLYVGPITGVGGTAYSVNYPGAASTSVYGPDTLGNGDMRLVGSYTTGSGQTDGFLFQGTVADLSNSSDYQHDREHRRRRDLHLHSQHDGRRGRGQRRRHSSPDRPRVRLQHLAEIRSPTSSIQAQHPRPPMGSGLTAARATRSAAAIRSVMSDGTSLAAGYLVNYDECDRAIHGLDFLQRPQWPGRPVAGRSFPGNQQYPGGRLYAVRQCDGTRIKLGRDRGRRDASGLIQTVRSARRCGRI